MKRQIFNKGDVDIFIHSWDLNSKDAIIDLYKPKKFVFEPQKDFSQLIRERKLNTLNDSPRPPASVLSHLYSVTESIKLAFECGEEYDIIIKARFDLGRINRNTSGPGKQNPYPVQCIKIVDDLKKDKIYLADWNHFHMGPADMWFYGSPNIMKEFTGLYDNLEREMKFDSDFYEFAEKIENKPGNLSNAIAFYKYWMINNGLWDNMEKIQTTWE
jgi:hypothetical protein